MSFCVYLCFRLVSAVYDLISDFNSVISVSRFSSFLNVSRERIIKLHSLVIMSAIDATRELSYLRKAQNEIDSRVRKTGFKSTTSTCCFVFYCVFLRLLTYY